MARMCRHCFAAFRGDLPFVGLLRRCKGNPVWLGLALALLFPGFLFAQSSGDDAASSGIVMDIAPVVVDGRELFRVRGIKAYPAQRRAGEIAGRIEAFAANADLDVGVLRLEETQDGTEIHGPDGPIGKIFDFDAQIQGVALNRQLMAETVLLRIREAITEYRDDRHADVLLVKLGYAIALTLLLVGVFAGGRWGYRKFSIWVEGRIPEHLEAVEAKSAQPPEGGSSLAVSCVAR